MSEQTLAEKFVKQLERKQSTLDIEVRPYYSGRSMYGRTCVGVTADISPFAIAIELAEMVNQMNDIDQDERESLMESLKNTRMDSMGLGNIYYFTDISLPRAPTA